MTALFVALGIMVLALLALLLWFVPRLLQQQVVRVSDDAAQLREMLLDLLSEQEAVTIRQTQLGAAIAQLQARFDVVAPTGGDTISLIDRVNELQQTLQHWAGQQRDTQTPALDGDAMRDTINEILVRIDALQVQQRDTMTLVDDGVLLGVKQLGERIHAMQLQIEAWEAATTQYRASDVEVLQHIQAQLTMVQQRIGQTSTLLDTAKTADLPSDTPTNRLSEE
jgi:uncharacterized small protein (DUF1192 family)